jgi:hypothetical protein
MPRFLITHADGSTRTVDADDEAKAKAHAERKNVLESTRPAAPAPDRGAVTAVAPAE